MAVLLKIKNRTITWTSNFTSGYLLKEDENTNLKRDMHSQCSLQHYLLTIAQIWRQPQHPSTDEWRRNIVWVFNTHNGILFSHRTEWNLVMYNNIKGSQGHHANWSKSDRERQRPYDLSYMGFSKERIKNPQVQRHREQNDGWQR